MRGDLKRYLTQIIERFAERDRRGIRRLEGNFSRMRIQRDPDSVLITDDRALPVALEGHRNNDASLFLGSAVPAAGPGGPRCI